MMILDKIDLSDFKDLVREEIQCMINFIDDENSIQSATNFANKHQKKKKNNKRKECFRCKEIEHFVKNCKVKLKNKNNDEEKKKHSDSFKGKKIKSFADLAYTFMTTFNSSISRDSDL